jgi:leucyl aminopeptidase
MKSMIAVNVKARKADPLKCVCDVLCVGVWAQEKLDKFAKQVDDALAGGIGKLIDLGDFKGSVATSALLYGNDGIPAKRVLLVGLGEKKKAKLDTVRNAASLASFKAVEIKAENVCMAMHYSFGGKFDIAQLGQATAEGVYMGSYRYDEFMAEDKKNSRVERIVFEVIESDSNKLRKMRKGVDGGVVIGQSQSFARTLCN